MTAQIIINFPTLIQPQCSPEIKEQKATKPSPHCGMHCILHWNGCIGARKLVKIGVCCVCSYQSYSYTKSLFIFCLFLQLFIWRMNVCRKVFKWKCLCIVQIVASYLDNRQALHSRCVPGLFQTWQSHCLHLKKIITKDACINSRLLSIRSNTWKYETIINSFLSSFLVDCFGPYCCCSPHVG